MNETTSKNSDNEIVIIGIKDLEEQLAIHSRTVSRRHWIMLSLLIFTAFFIRWTVRWDINTISDGFHSTTARLDTISSGVQQGVELGRLLRQDDVLQSEREKVLLERVRQLGDSLKGR